MAQVTTSPQFEHYYSYRNSRLVEVLRRVHLRKAMSILTMEPFCYSGEKAKDIAEDVIDGGGALMCNCDEPEPGLEEINNMGERRIACLMINGDQLKLFPHAHIKVKKQANNLQDCLQVIADFLNSPPQSHSSTIALLNPFSDDEGLIFGDGTRVTRDILETHVFDYLNACQSVCPQVIDLVFSYDNGNLAVSTLHRTRTFAQIEHHIVIG